jgi:hypothetical protein
VRGDAGFFGKRLLEFLDGERLGYAIVAKEYAPIKRWARVCRFKKLRTGWEVGELRYQAGGWRAPHRFVVVRRPIPTDPVEAKQLTLFTDTKYAYHVLVTNLRTDPWRVWRFYAPRARIEKHIRELLYDYTLAKIPTAEWIPYMAFFQLRCDALLSAALPAGGLPDQDPEDYPTRTPGHSRAAGQIAGPLSVEAAQGVSFPVQRDFEFALRQIQKLVPIEIP